MKSPNIPPPEDPPQKRGIRFWMAFLSMCVSVFLAVLDAASVSTALPTIAEELHSESEFVWVGTAYTLAATAFLPLASKLSHVFGRRPALLLCLIFFTAGSALCGASTTMTVMIAGRTLQGMGGGGIISLINIIISDMVPLRERGNFQGIYAGIFALGGGVGPIIAGSLTQKATWRWLFYLNLPICFVAFVLVILFLQLPTPQKEIPILVKLGRIDITGNMLLAASSTSCIIALNWGGVSLPWSSAKVLIPLCVGIAGLAGALLWEAKVAREPTVPLVILNSRTALSGQISIFLWSISSVSILYFVPAYFQACKGASALRSGVLLLGLAFVMPVFSIIAGKSVAALHLYRPQNYLGWLCSIGGLAIFSVLKADDPIAKSVGAEILLAAGLGSLAVSLVFPILAPVSIPMQPQAVALFAFTRQFGQSWGIAIGGTILQNQLRKRLPAGFVSRFPQGQQIAYSVIPILPTLPQPLLDEVRVAFAQSLNVFFEVLAAICALGLLVTLLQKEIPLAQHVDAERAFREKESQPIEGDASSKT